MQPRHIKGNSMVEVKNGEANSRLEFKRSDSRQTKAYILPSSKFIKPSGKMSGKNSSLGR